MVKPSRQEQGIGMGRGPAQQCQRRMDGSGDAHEGLVLNPSIILVFISHSVSFSCVSGNCLFALGSDSYIRVNIF